MNVGNGKAFFQIIYFSTINCLTIIVLILIKRERIDLSNGIFFIFLDQL